MTIGCRAARVLAALAVTAAMGFGGAQAFASPGAAADALACTLKQCTEDCLQIGYNVGRCEQGTCVCYWTAPTGAWSIHQPFTTRTSR